MTRLLIFFSIILFLSCESQNAKTESKVVLESEEPETDSVLVSEQINVPIQEFFDLRQFHFFVDSISPILSGYQRGYEVKIDSFFIENGDLLHRHDRALSEYLVEKSVVSFKYSFIDLNKTRALDFRVLELDFNDSTVCDSVFATLTRYATTPDVFGGFKRTPGLTYQHDYVAKGKTKILWLTNSCRFGYKYHKSLLGLLLKSTSSFITKKSIDCKCGMVSCKKQQSITVATKQMLGKR